MAGKRSAAARASGRRPPLGGTDSTAILLQKAREGDDGALEALFARCTPLLRDWARGRLPVFARGLGDTEDLVQETILHTLRRLPSFQSRHTGALQAYLRQALANRIRDAVRHANRHPALVELPEGQEDPSASPLERAIGREAVEIYEQALQRLRPKERDAVVARIELQYGYVELAAILGTPTANAARVAVMRALARLVEEMSHGH